MSLFNNYDRMASKATNASPKRMDKVSKETEDESIFNKIGDKFDEFFHKDESEAETNIAHSSGSETSLRNGVSVNDEFSEYAIKNAKMAYVDANAETMADLGKHINSQADYERYKQFQDLSTEVADYKTEKELAKSQINSAADAQTYMERYNMDVATNKDGSMTVKNSKGVETNIEHESMRATPTLFADLARSVKASPNYGHIINIGAVSRSTSRFETASSMTSNISDKSVDTGFDNDCD